jgi:hypothetical protein
MEPAIVHIANFGTDTAPSRYVAFADRARVQYVHWPVSGCQCCLVRRSCRS